MNQQEINHNRRWMERSRLYQGYPQFQTLFDALFNEASRHGNFCGIKRDYPKCTPEPYIGVKATNTGRDSLFYVEVKDDAVVLTYYEWDATKHAVRRNGRIAVIEGSQAVSSCSDIQALVNRLMARAK